MNANSFLRGVTPRGSLPTRARAHTARTLQVLAIALSLGACSSDAGTTASSPAGTPTPPPTNTPAATPSPTTTTPVASNPPATPPAVMPPPSSMPAPVTGGAGAPNTPPAPVAMPPMGGPDDMMQPGMMDEPVEMGTPTIFWLNLQADTVWRANADGSMATRFASGGLLQAPDGVTVDPVEKHVFVLNMGSDGQGGRNNASLVRFNLDGSGAAAIIPAGTRVDGEAFNTGKQVTMDRTNRKLYMGDREGSKVWRSDMDGKNLEVLVSGHGIQQVVGVAADPTKEHFYFSDRNGKKLFRANMKMPDGQTHANRMDLEMLYLDKAPNAMPLDLELDLKTRTIYWTDRQQNKVFSMPMDLPAGQDGMTRTDVKTVASNLRDVIGLGYDHQDGVLYVTHYGSVSRFKTDGSELKQIGMSGTTGIAFVRIP